MASPEQQQPGPYSSEQIRELLTFLREESSANKEHLRSQAEDDRQLLKHTLWIVAVPLTALIAVAGFFGFKSVTDLKDSIRTQAQAETKTEIARMQADTEKQIKAMQVEIRSRLDQQFQNPAIREVVKDAAKEQTQTTAGPLIQGAVATQVKARLDEEQGNIRRTVTEQTQSAVKQMGTQIDKLVKDSVETNIQNQMGPLEKQVNSFKTFLDLQRLITRMNTDDALAFDSLMRFPANTLQPDEQQLVVSSLRSIFLAQNQGFFMTRSFTPPLSDQDLIGKLSSGEATERQAALDTLTGKKPVHGSPSTTPITFALLSKCVDMLQHDRSLSVRASAYRLFNAWTGQQFKILDANSLVPWWIQHQKEFIP